MKRAWSIAIGMMVLVVAAGCKGGFLPAKPPAMVKFRLAEWVGPGSSPNGTSEVVPSGERNFQISLSRSLTICNVAV